MVVLDDLAVLTRPGAAERRAEVAGTEARGPRARPRVARIEAPGTLDGGDVLQVGTTVYVGRGGRTNAEGIRQLRARGDARAHRRARRAAPRAPPEVRGHRAARRHDRRRRPLPARHGAVPDAAASCPRRPARTSSRSAAARSSWPPPPRASAALLAGEGLDVVAVDIGEFEKLEGCVTCLSVLVGHARDRRAPAGAPPVRSRACPEPTVEAGPAHPGGAAARHRRGARVPVRGATCCGAAACASPRSCTPTRRRSCCSTPDGDVLRARAAKGIEEEVEQGVEIPRRPGVRRPRRRRAAGRSPSRTSTTPTSSTRSCARRASARCSACRCWPRGASLGVLHVGTPRPPRAFTADERDLLQARGRPRGARHRARRSCSSASGARARRRARAQLEALQRITDAALAYLPEDELLHRAAGPHHARVMGTDTAAILLLDPAARRAARARREGHRGGGRAGRRDPGRQGVRGPRSPPSGGRSSIEDVDHADILNPILREKGIRSLLGVPLLVEGRVARRAARRQPHAAPRSPPTSATSCSSPPTARRSPSSTRCCTSSAGWPRRSSAGCCPQSLERVAGLEVASRYLPASGETLGGDWYDAFPLGGGRVALAVGDVVGHGIEAAAVMAQLRTALRAYAADGHPPAAVVERVNRLMWALGPRRDDHARVRRRRPRAGVARARQRRPPPAARRSPPDGRAVVPAAAGQHRARRHRARRATRATTHPAPGRDDGRALHGRPGRAARRVDRRAASSGCAAHRARGDAASTALCDAAGRPARRRARAADDVAIIAARVPPLAERLSGALAGGPRVARGRPPRCCAAGCARPRRGRRRGLRHHRRLPGGVRERGRARLPARAGEAFDARGDVRAAAASASTSATHGRWRPPRGTNRGRGLLADAAS